MHMHIHKQRHINTWRYCDVATIIFYIIFYLGIGGDSNATSIKYSKNTDTYATTIPKNYGHTYHHHLTKNAYATTLMGAFLEAPVDKKKYTGCFACRDYRVHQGDR